jgi:hypothetical protein
MLIPVPSLQPETRYRRGGLSDFFLTRLGRPVALRPQPGLPFDAERLVHHAIYSTYVDCRDLGLRQPADALVACLRR